MERRASAPGAGFTLIETLVSLVVLAFVIVAVTQGMRFGQQAWVIQARAVATTSDMDAVDRTVRGLVEHLNPGSIVATTTKIAGSAHEVSFASVLPQAAANLPTPEADVTLTTRGRRFVLLWRPHYRAPIVERPPTETALVDGIERLDISYWGANPQGSEGWLQTWSDALPPSLIRVRIVFPKDDKRVWPDIVAAPMARTAPAVRRRERGFALLIVLWSLSMLALVASQLTSAGRAETQLAGNLRTQAILESAADGALMEGVFHLAQESWAADGVPHPVRIAGVTASVRMTDEVSKVNPNYVAPALLKALLRNVGLDPHAASDLAAAMTDFRTRGNTPRAGGAKLPQYRAAGLEYGPSGRPFESLDEIGLVLGMTPRIMARLRPHLSIYKEGDVQRSSADPLAAQALDDAELGAPVQTQPLLESSNLVARVSATARAGGAAFTRVATVRIKRSLLPDDPVFQILTWDEGEAAASQ